MLIGFDASRAFASEATGTENYSRNLLRALAKIDRKNRYRVYLRGSSQFMVDSSQINKTVNREPITKNFIWPANFEFKVIRPYRLWTQVGLALETWRNPVDLLFVPAHTLPIFRRRNIAFSNFQFPLSNYLKIFQLKSRKSMIDGKWQMVNRSKYVVTIHDLGVEYLPGYHQFPQRYYLDLASRYAARHADALIAVSHSTKADLIKRYGIATKKIFVVPEGVDTAIFAPSSKLKVQSVKSKYKIKGDYVLFVGTVQPRKNLEMLIKAFSLLVHSSQFIVQSRSRKKSVNREPITDNLTLVIAGKLGWDYDEILKAPKKFGVEDRVKFIGYVSDEDLPALYSGATVLAAPSLFEGFDLPILEALSCGCGVAASDIPAHREILNSLMEYARGSVGSSSYGALAFGRFLTRDQMSLRSTEGPWPLANGVIARSKASSPRTLSKLRNMNYQLPTSDSVRIAEAMILVKPDDIEEWVHVLYQYISIYEKRLTLVTKMRNLASKFSWEEAAKSTLAVFERVLG